MNCKRQKPGHDEIERVQNETHSIIWKCSECQLGLGYSVVCGTSVSISVSLECVPCVEGFNFSNRHDYSPCKPCMKCADHELTSGRCTAEDDTTKCLGTCSKGFYWNGLTDSCHPCSVCCEGNITDHEKQCESSGLPLTNQCRQTSLNCTHPSNSSQNTSHEGTCDKGFYWNDLTDSCHPCSVCCEGNITDLEKQCENSGLPLTHQCRQSSDICTHAIHPSNSSQNTSHEKELVHKDQPKKQTLPSYLIVIIVISIVIVLVVLVLVVMWRCCGCQKAKTILEFIACFCCRCCHSANTTNGITMHFNHNANDTEAFVGRVTEIQEASDKLGSLKSGEFHSNI